MKQIALVLTLVVACGGLLACQPVPSYSGSGLFAANCSSCHGVYGEGDGPVAAALRVPMMDLRYLAARNDGKFPTDRVYKIIDGRELRVAHGRRNMPVWGEEFLIAEGFDAGAEARVSAKISAVVSHLEGMQLPE